MLRSSNAVQFTARIALLCALLAAAACSSSSDTTQVGNDAGQKPSARSSDRIYVTVAADNEVLVVDEPSHTVHGKIKVGHGPAIILATPDYEKLYTANWANNSVSAISVATEEVTSIMLPGRPYVIAMAPQGDFVYAGLAGNQIAVIDTTSDQVSKMFPATALPASIIVSDDGATLYVATLSGSLSALASDTGKPVQTKSLRVGSTPAWITSSHDGKKVYTLNFLSDDVSVVDTASWSVETTVSTGKGSQAIIGNVTPDDAFLYVTNYGAGNMLAIDTKTNTIARTFPLDGRPVGVNFSPDGSRVYVTDFGPPSLAKPVDTNFLLTGSFSTSDPGQISVFDTATGKLVGEKLIVGPGPTSLVYVPR